MLKNSTISVLRRSPALLLKRASVTAKGEFGGYASRFGEVDSSREIVMPGAFAESLAQHRQQGTTVKLLWQHDSFTPIGGFDEIAEDEIGLRVAGRFNLDTDAGRNAHAHVREGDVDGMSIGYTVPIDGVEVDPEARVVRLKRIGLFEISVVTFPMLRTARVDAVKMLGSIADLERGLRGEVPLQLPRGAVAKMAPAAWAALFGDEPDTIPNLAPLAETADKAAGDIERLKGLFK